MNGKICKKVLAIIVILVVVMASISCKDSVDLSIYVSELRSAIYEGKDNNVTLTVYAEEREDPFIIDGFVGELKKVLIVKLQSEGRSIDSASVLLSFDGVSCEGDFEYSPLNGKYCTEIFVEKLPSSPVINAVFKCGEESVNLELKTQVNNGNLSYSEVLDSVRKYDSNTVKELFDNTNVSTEIHIRLISDKNKNYYYVGFSEKSGKIYAYLVDGVSGEVLAKKSA